MRRKGSETQQKTSYYIGIMSASIRTDKETRICFGLTMESFFWNNRLIAVFSQVISKYRPQYLELTC